MAPRGVFRQSLAHLHTSLYAVDTERDVNVATRLSHHCAVKPPSTSRLWPVTNDALLDESQMTASAISSDLPMRPMGCMADIVAWFSALSPTKRRYMSVSIAAGNTALMRMPCLPNSTAADFVRPMTACLLAA